jgi:hypothetical protein
MSQSARVSSIDALRALHAALVNFGPQAREALGAAAIEIRRVLEFTEDQLKYWQRQAEKRREDVNRARVDLTHARAMHDGSSTGCVEQELALRKAQARLREAEEKIVTCRRWLMLLPQAISEYEEPARHLGGILDADFRHGLVRLQSKIAVLEAYTAVDVQANPSAVPAATPPPSASSEKGPP